MGGLSAARLYRFEHNHHQYVLRLLPTNLDHATRTHHIHMTRMAGNMGIGPKVHYVDDNAQAIVMDFVVGKSSSYSGLQDPFYVQSCAKLLARLHQSTADFPCAHSPFNRFFEFLDKAQQQNSAYCAELMSIKDTMAQLEKIFATCATKMVPCHLDLHPLNILMSDKRPFFVDWVNGGISNPYFDLATFAQFHCLESQEITMLLANYFGRSPTEFELQYFTLAKPIRLIVIGAAYLCTIQDKKSTYSNPQQPISFAHFIELQLAGPLDLSYEQIGLTMLHAGLELIEEQAFKNTLNALR